MIELFTKKELESKQPKIPDYSSNIELQMLNKLGCISQNIFLLSGKAKNGI